MHFCKFYKIDRDDMSSKTMGSVSSAFFVPIPHPGKAVLFALFQFSLFLTFVSTARTFFNISSIDSSISRELYCIPETLETPMMLLPYTIFIYVSLVIGSENSDIDDEKFCVEPKWFRCANKRCLSFWFVCDGENDCGDNTDEINCPDSLNRVTGILCSTDQFQCDDDTCISLDNFCDRQHDCPDKSDEYIGCTEHKKCNDFRCKNGYCVKNELVCDGFDDCSDFSDENNCGNRTVPPEQCNNKINRFLCNNGRCTLINNTCNGKDDCGDNSDEHETECKISEDLCAKGIGCSHYCNKTPKGPACSCPTGHRLTNNQTCTDINECTENSELCDQRCVNNAGSYYCSCEAGYELQDDKKTCKAEGGEALMIFSTRKEIHGYYLESEINFPLVENLESPVGVSIVADYIYWTNIEIGNRTIVRSREDGTNPEVIVTAGLGKPEEIAIDWLTGNFYFTDTFWKHIGVCDNDGKYCTVIIWEKLEVPSGLVLYPLNGEMYWSDCGAKPGISRAGMNGAEAMTLVTENLERPTCLAIDYASKRLYWIDSGRSTVESIDLDGRDRRQVLQTTADQYPRDIAIFENRLYWSDWKTNSIQSIEKISGKNRTTIFKANSTIYGIDIYHTVLRSNSSNPCSIKPCSEICLLAINRTYTCACSLEKELNTDGRTCNVTKKKQQQQSRLVVASGDTIIDYHDEILGKPRINHSPTLKSINRLAYDSITASLLANDRFTNSIFRFDLDNREIGRIADTSSDYLGGMDFDNYGNNIYWTDSGRRSIVVRSLETGEKVTFQQEEEPHDILVIPRRGIMYVVFKKGEKYSIDKMPMSGNGTTERVIENLGGPKISLAHDNDSDRIFFSDESNGIIETIFIDHDDDNERRIFRAGLMRPVSLAVVERNVFWTLRNLKILQFTDKRDRVPGVKSVSLGAENSVDMMNLVGTEDVYDDDDEWHECRNDNGGCSHVCLVAVNQDYPVIANSSICACPTGMILEPDNLTCSLGNLTTKSETRKCTGCALLC